MLEGLVAGLLNRFLGLYVKNFDPTQLKVGIWSGDVKLRDLELRREALDQLKLPINVVEGHLGQLTLTIPWSNLSGAPVKIYIEDVFLLASPKEEAQYDEEEEDRRKQRLKMEKLESAELLKERSQEGLSTEEQKKSQSFTQSLVTKVVDNLQVEVKNIHIRYEDSISAPGHPFALGVTLQEFSAVSTDEGWRPAFIQTVVKSTNKLVTLGALAIYWNTDTELLGTGREAVVTTSEKIILEEILDKFKKMIPKAESTELVLDGGAADDSTIMASGPEAVHQFILRPVSGQAKVELDKTDDVQAPNFKANLIFDEIGVVLDDHQYRDALMMVDLFHYFTRHQEYKKYHPKGVRPLEDPRAWFRFAGNAVLGKIHERNRRWTWGYFRQRRDDRRRYIHLFRKKKQNQTLTPDETDDMTKLERELGYEDLRFWRSLARNQMKKENAVAMRNQSKSHTQGQQQQQQGWISWMWGSKPADQTSDETENTQITEQQRQELYEAIEWDEKTALAADIDIPRDAIKLQIEASLSTGSFTLRQSPHKDNVRDLLSLHFDVFCAKTLQRSDSLLLHISLGGLRLNDGTTPDSLFTEIVRVKDAPGTSKKRRLSVTELELVTVAEEESFFQFQVEQNPLDGQGDVAVTAKLKPLEIVWNPNLVVGVWEFFKPPERHMESITALMETAGATVEGFREQTRAGLEFALEEHKTINAKLDLQAPLIIIPQSITTRESTCLILDAGHISVNSELADIATTKEIQSKQSQAYTDADFKRLESLMYDRFIVKLTSTQLLIGPSIEETKAQLVTRDDAMRLHIVDKINVDFIVETSILPRAPNLTRVKMSGRMPMLHASVSDTKYKSLIKIIDVAIPKFDAEFPEPEEESPRAPLSRSRILSESSTPNLRNSQQPPSQLLSLNSSQEPAIVLDDDDDEDNFEDAHSGGSISEQLKLQQRMFQFTFSVDKLRGSLFRSDPDNEQPDSLLVELVAQDFNLDFYLRPFDIAAEVSLGSVSVDDFVSNPPAEFKSIVSSGDVEDKQQQRALVHVKFVRVKRESPEFMPVYEGVETNVNVAISTINLIVTRKTLLTLLDFILVTFADAGNSDSAKIHDSPRDTKPRTSVLLVAVGEDGGNEATLNTFEEQRGSEGSAIRVKVDLKTIRLILNNDGVRLATLSFNHADVGLFLLGPALRLSTKLGNLTLTDDVNLGLPESSELRKLITIEGDDLADFRYETFDVANAKTYPGFDSSIFLRAGSVKVNFKEESFRKIINFLVKFGKMQAVYNAARQAATNQATNLQQSQSRFKFDVVIKTPIVMFPRVVLPGRAKRDLLTAYLGEIYAQNSFAPLDGSHEPTTAMKLSAGIRNIRLTSLLHYPGDKSEELQLIDHVDLAFQVTHAEHSPGAKRPDTEIVGHMTDLNLRITQCQLRFLLEISKTVPAAFTSDGDQQRVNEELELDIDDRTLQRARSGFNFQAGHEEDESRIVDLGPELGSHSDTWTKVDLVFKIGSIGLELINGMDDQPVESSDNASLSRFSLDRSQLKLRAQANGSLEAELAIDSFTIHDSRRGEANKYRRIMSSSNKNGQQFMAGFTMSGGIEQNIIALVAIDSPRVIFALDYIFAIQRFIVAGFTPRQPLSPNDVPLSPINVLEGSDADSQQMSFYGLQVQREQSRKSSDMGLLGLDQKPQDQSEPTLNISFRINVVDAQIILIANPLSTSSEAIVLGTKQVLLSQQHVTTFQLSQVGMYLCRMDHFEDSRLRIIDDYSVQLSIDGSKPNFLAISVDVEPLVLRLSLRDILLVLQIIRRASELSQGSQKEELKPSAADKKAKQLRQPGTKQRIASGRIPPTLPNQSTPLQTASAETPQRAIGSGAQMPRSGQTSSRECSILKDGQEQKEHEELTATVDGIRIILIGDLHELPILDMSIKKFSMIAEDWSSCLGANTSIEMYTNVYNFSKSAWEPLIEPWQVAVGVRRDRDTGLLAIDVTSRRTFDVTITTAAIALASKSFDFLTQNQDVLSKPRGEDAPYRIRNYTGFGVVVTSRNQSSNENIQVRLEDSEEAPWSFEQWEKMRENLVSESQSASVQILLESSGFDAVKNIHLSREGEFLFSLQPKSNQVLHRLLVDVRLGHDNVKYVTLRSPLLVENDTQIPIEIGVYDARDGHLLKIEKIAPGEARPAPVGAVYLKSLIVRPDSGFGYDWSSDTLWWRDLLKQPTKTMVCKGDHSESFFFQVNANFERDNPLVQSYPYMKIKLSAPVVLENLLPYDFKYRIYDKNTKRDWTNFLRKGGVSPVHVTELSHLLLLSVDMQDTSFKPSEFAIINSGTSGDFAKETSLVCKDDAGLNLHLRLYYHRILGAGGAFKVTVYSPYVILNKTGVDLDVRSKGFMQQAKSAAGQILAETTRNSRTSVERPKVVPFMFSYSNDDHHNRALLKVGDSEWSKPQSFDAIGSFSEVVLQSTQARSTEIHIGISVEQGEGKYKMTKIVTLAPRFVIQNNLDESINIREPSSSTVMPINAGALQPLHFLQKSATKQLSLCYADFGSQWSSPFNISDIGTTFIKMAKPGQRQLLVRADILMEGATIFLNFSIEAKNWPFSMRNESDSDFTFYQANPNVDEDGVEDVSGWRPIRYRLPPRSIMPYAWDFPAAKYREVVINTTGKERHVKLAEIGNQLPMKVVPISGQTKIIDINVTADGPTQTLILSNYRPSMSLYRQRSQLSTTSTSGSTSGSGERSRTSFEAKEQDTDINFRAQLRLAGIGVSLINSQLKELAYVTLRDVQLKYQDSLLYQTITMAVKWIQVDNQLYGGIFPMILYPSVVTKRAQDIDSHPSLHLMITRVKDDSYGVEYIKYATVLLQEMTLELDEDFVFAVLDFSKLPGESWASEGDHGQLCDDSIGIPKLKMQQSGKELYFELLNLQPMQLNISFVRTERVNAEDKSSSRNPLMFFFNILTMAIGNVNDAPVRLNALILENVRVSIPVLTQNISSHYSQETLYQIHKILGSADFLGNPVGLFNNISSGITDIFYEPYQGLIMSDRPEELGLGLARGAASFVKKSVYGVSDSVSKFTGAMSKGLAAATLDKQFQDRRRITRARNRPKHALYGVTAGANSFITSVASGVGGLARKPLEGAEQEGALGFFKGIGKGVIGVATKPVIGVLDLASNVSEGIRNTTTVFDGSELDRVRLTRFIPADGIVRPYSQREALGQFWLKQVDNGRYFDEIYIGHLDLPQEDMVVMVTYARILLNRSRRLTTEWDAPLRDIQGISKERTGISITLRGNMNGPFVPVVEESGRTFLYRMVTVAVEEFNRRSRVL
ncbi:vacuolar protein sorting-associated protein vps13 [Grosmannia clavigera kw1407]|uniref:Vacuolar protein sorting-associated protein vps13 n=1 Tax=Grosmannia clavigera (strain kw1407 / UAMH 11150) TaxID=655863 RepID=F0XV75_GROCL|nr:vacuolar protein sorting-associated protein vps13 [Grosmannia clavigera kw1407]EFW98970.1 vacuolar protein sorting-associated protein vps13 [Grosmannia clavigera kw1407]